jgi:hypothetical protein
MCVIDVMCIIKVIDVLELIKIVRILIILIIYWINSIEINEDGCICRSSGYGVYNL